MLKRMLRNIEDSQQELIRVKSDYVQISCMGGIPPQIQCTLHARTEYDDICVRILSSEKGKATERRYRTLYLEEVDLARDKIRSFQRGFCTEDRSNVLSVRGGLLCITEEYGEK